jgi:hypothetical protein
MKRALNFIVFLLFILLIPAFFWRARELSQRPEPYEICFRGLKIVFEGEINLPENFSQEAPFEEAAAWGPEATLVFGGEYENFYFKIWRPDYSGNGAQYAEKNYGENGPWKNILWKIGKVERLGNKFIFFPKWDKGCIPSLLFILAIIILISHSSWKSFKKI